jgi:hypothetical protein
VRALRNKSLARGAVRGVGATAVMTLPMLARWALRPEPPPPLVVAENAQRLVGLEPTQYPAVLRHASWAGAHLAFGTALGAAAELWPARATTGRSASSYGLAVWAAGYALALPAARLYPRLDRDDRLRAVESLLAHVVYGATLGRLAA